MTRPRIIEWEGHHLPDELHALPPGRYLLEALDDGGADRCGSRRAGRRPGPVAHRGDPRDLGASPALMQLIVSPQARDGFREAYRFVTANNPEAADSTQERP